MLINILARVSDYQPSELGFCFDKYWKSINILFEGNDVVGIEDWDVENALAVFGLEIEYVSDLEEF